MKPKYWSGVFVLEPSRPFVRKYLQLRSIDTQLTPIHWRTGSNPEATARTTVARKSLNDKHILPEQGAGGTQDRTRASGDGADNGIERTNRDKRACGVVDHDTGASGRQRRHAASDRIRPRLTARDGS